MVEKLTVDLFAEDRAHEEFVGALLRRICREQNLSLELKLISARRGSPKMKHELSTYQKLVQQGQGSPDVLIVVRDTNCSSPNEVHTETEEWIDKRLFAHFVVACPEPHIERWFMADPSSLQQVVGDECQPGKIKCERGRYKKMLVDAIRSGGNETRLRGIDFAKDLVKEMDFYRAGKNEPSLKTFVEEVRGVMKLIKN